MTRSPSDSVGQLEDEVRSKVIVDRGQAVGANGVKPIGLHHCAGHREATWTVGSHGQLRNGEVAFLLRRASDLTDIGA